MTNSRGTGKTTVTVALTVRITLNAEDWITTFGEDPRENPQDVSDYVEHALLPGGVFGDGEVDNAITCRLATKRKATSRAGSPDST